MKENRVLQERIALVEANLSKLARLAKLRMEDFLSDFTKVAAAKHLFQISVETFLDCAYHLIAQRGWPPPGSRRGVIEKLFQEGLIGGQGMERHGELIDLRNRTVHLYLGITDEEVHEILQDRLRDIKLFIEDLLRIEGTARNNRGSL